MGRCIPKFCGQMLSLISNLPFRNGLSKWPFSQSKVDSAELLFFTHWCRLFDTKCAVVCREGGFIRTPDPPPYRPALEWQLQRYILTYKISSLQSHHGTSFSVGLNEIVPENLLSIFDENELEVYTYNVHVHLFSVHVKLFTFFICTASHVWCK